MLKLENNHLVVRVEPQMGGRVLSIISKPSGHELLFQAQSHHLPPGSHKNIFTPLAYGWDDCFPNVIAAGPGYPDHGILWSHSAKIISQTDVSIELNLKHKNWEIVKRLTLFSSSIQVELEIQSLSTLPTEAFLTTHLLARFEEGMRLFPEIPYEEREYPTSSLSDRGERMIGPLETSRKWWLRPEAAEKYFNRIPTECGILYPNLRMKYSMEWDQDQFPYLGLWVTSGEYQGDKNLAWEISDGYFDSLEVAKSNDRLPSFQPKQTKKFSYQIKWEPIQ